MPTPEKSGETLGEIKPRGGFYVCAQASSGGISYQICFDFSAGTIEKAKRFTESIILCKIPEWQTGTVSLWEHNNWQEGWTLTRPTPDED